MKKQILLILGCVVLLANCQAAIYKKVLVDDKDARCLDGTQGAYFIS